MAWLHLSCWLALVVGASFAAEAAKAILRLRTGGSGREGSFACCVQGKVLVIVILQPVYLSRAECDAGGTAKTYKDRVW
jgi:hypothetical protein